MKIVVALLVGAVIAAVGVGLYVRNDESGERDRAEGAANEFAAYFSRAGATKCEASRIEPLADDGMWLFHLDCGQGSRCFTLDPDKFTTIPPGMYVEGSVEGVSSSSCAPELWTASDASRRLQASQWARERRAQFVSCSPGDGNRYAQYAREFICRYDSERGSGSVTIRTTGASSFEVESDR